MHPSTSRAMELPSYLQVDCFISISNQSVTNLRRQQNLPTTIITHLVWLCALHLNPTSKTLVWPNQPKSAIMGVKGCWTCRCTWPTELCTQFLVQRILTVFNSSAQGSLRWPATNMPQMWSGKASLSRVWNAIVMAPGWWQATCNYSTWLHSKNSNEIASTETHDQIHSRIFMGHCTLKWVARRWWYMWHSFSTLFSPHDSRWLI